MQVCDTIIKTRKGCIIVMNYREIKADLFTMPEDHALAHCISSDFALGAGIAKLFEKKYNLRKKLNVALPGYVATWDNMEPKGVCIRTGRVLNLVTKRNYWNKPTYETMCTALLSMKKCCEHYGISKVACPLIGCGLDRLEWCEVSVMLQEVFADTDVELVVCKL